MFNFFSSLYNILICNSYLNIQISISITFNFKVYINFDQAKELKEYCDYVGIEFLASAFNLEGVKWCEKLGQKRHKIASRCIEQADLIEAMCKTGKEIIVSLGMWHKEEFPVINTKAKVSFLYCVAKYPTAPEDLNFLKVDFNKYSGFSDHTIGIEAALVAMARGARIIEKHFTLDKGMHGPDHISSMEPAELKQLADFSRKYEKILYH